MKFYNSKSVRAILSTVLMTACLLLISTGVLYAQNTKGKDFWFAEFANVSSVNSPIAIVVANSGTLPATVTISKPDATASNFTVVATQTIAAGSLYTFTFNSVNSTLQQTGTYTNNVYHITSDRLVVAYGFTPLTNVKSNDADLLLPVPALGKKYFLGSYVSPFSAATLNSMYGVVATGAGNTTVKSFKGGVLVDSVVLKQGQSFQKFSGKTQADDVTGWYVETSQNAAVFTGNQITAVGNSAQAADHLEEQALPLETIAKTYVAAPSNTRPIGCTTCSPDIFRYVATEDNTVITTNPNVGTWTLNKGQYAELQTSTPHVVTGSKPFYAYQLLISQNAGSPVATIGDPSLFVLPVIDQFQYDYTFLVPNTFAYNFLNFIAPVGTNFRLDGKVVTPVFTTAGTVNGVTYQVANIPVTGGAHTVVADQKIGITVQGFDQFASYAYLGGSGLEPINAGCITGGPYQILSCVAGTNAVQMRGTPSCSNGGTPRVRWTSTDGVKFSDNSIANPIATVYGFGTFSVTMTVYCGSDSVSCTSEINVRPALAGCGMTLQPPPNKVVYSDSGVSYATNVAIGVATYTSTNPATLSNNAPARYPLGVNNVTWTLTDDVTGETLSGIQTVTVLAGPPVITPPPAITVYNDQGVTYATNPAIGTATYSVAVDPALLTNNAPIQFPLGNTTVTWTVTDGLGQTASGTQIVTVISKPPTIVAPPTVTVTAGYNGIAAGVDLRANGNETYTASVDPATVTNDGLTQYPIGTSTVKWTVKDGLGRTASDLQQVIVVAPKPTLIPPPDITVSNDPGQTYATGVNLGLPTVQAVGPYTLTNDAPAQFALGTTTVKWTLVDAYGNTVSGTHTVTVVSAPPTIVAPPTVTIVAGFNGYATGVDLRTNGNETYTVSVDPATITNDGLTQYPIGTSTVKWTVKDGLGRTASDLQQVIVVAPKPTLIPPPDITVSNDPGQTYATGVNLGLPTVQAVGPYTLTNDAPAQFPIGTTTVKWTLVDAYGNTVSGTHTVTVVSAPPTIVAPPTVTVVAGFNGYATGVNLRANGNETYTVSVNPATVTNNGSTQYAIGTSTVKWTVKDGLGRTASDLQQVIVVAPKPTLIPPPNITVSNDPGQTYATGVNLGLPTVQAVGPYTLTNDAPAQFPIGTTTVKWTLVDAYGNTVSGTHTVTVVSAPPTIVAPPTVTVVAGFNGYATGVNLRANGNETYTVSVNPATVTNNGSPQYAIGTSTVKWTVKDGLGRTASDLQQVIVVAPKPTLIPPPNITVSNDPGQTYATGVNLGLPTVQAVGPYTLTNDAPTKFPIGTTTVKWTLVDAYGNTVSGTHTVTVVSAPPTLVPPPAITVTIPYGQTSTTISNIGTATYTVSVNPAVLTNNAPASASYPVGATTVTWTVKDGLGRTASGTQLITVNVEQPVTGTQGCTPGFWKNWPQAWGCGYTSTTKFFSVFAGVTNYQKVSANLTLMEAVDLNGGSYNALARHAGAAILDACHPKVSYPYTQAQIKSAVVAMFNTGRAVLGNKTYTNVDDLKNELERCNQLGCPLGMTNFSPYVQGASKVKEESLTARVYPNPSSAMFTLQVKSSDENAPINIRIIDAFGRTVEVMNNIGTARTLMFGEKYASGAYYAEILQGDQKKVVPLMKAK